MEPKKTIEEQMAIALDNCYKVVDPLKQMPIKSLDELLNSEPDYSYYVTFFVCNTCTYAKSYVEDEDGEIVLQTIEPEVLDGIGKFFRDGGKNRKEKALKEIFTYIWELMLSDIPIFENPLFMGTWNRLVELALQYKIDNTLDDGHSIDEIQKKVEEIKIGLE